MVSLNVRAAGPKNPELPETLYQRMPLRAMALLATVPRGAFAVSIPGESGPAGGYPILGNAPEPAGGFVIVYDRKPNGRYEAVAAHHQNHSFQISEFVEFARRWVDRNGGALTPIAARHAYFVPSIDEWGVILRDNGYAALDPIILPSKIDAELLLRRKAQRSSAMLARIPVFTGDQGCAGDFFPVFARVEVTLDPDPGPHSAWLSFGEYKKIRDLLSQPPDAIVPDFHEWIGLLAKESGLECWIFHPGMMFGDRIEWWGDRCRRRTEHEGCDFALGSKPGANLCPIPPGTTVRSIAAGELIAVLDDFLGKTVVVRHSNIIRANGDVFCTLLSHIRPVTAELGVVGKDQVLGEVSRSMNPRVPSHLHLTGAWIPANLASDTLRMDLIHPAFAPVALVNFTNLLQSNPLCRLDASLP